MRKYTSALLAALVLVTVILSGCSEGIGAPEEISRSNASTSQNAPVSSASSSAASQNNVSSSKQKDGSVQNGCTECRQCAERKACKGQL